MDFGEDKRNVLIVGNLKNNNGFLGIFGFDETFKRHDYMSRLKEHYDVSGCYSAKWVGRRNQFAVGTDFGVLVVDLNRNYDLELTFCFRQLHSGEFL